MKGMSLMKKIEKLKAWAVKNYDNGADTMVECWNDDMYRDLLYQVGGNFNKARSVLVGMAEVYRERIADAKNSAF